MSGLKQYPWLAAAAILALTGSAIAEDITVTSYFPSPRGVYEQIITTSHALLGTDAGVTGGAVKVGDNTAPTALSPKFSVTNGAHVIAVGGTLTTAAPDITVTGSGTNPMLQLVRTGAGPAAMSIEALQVTAVPSLRVNGGQLVVSALGAGTGDVRAGGAYFCNQAVDFSEHLAVGAIQAQAVMPGHVMVVDPDQDEAMRLSDRAYDPGVAGVIATQPGLLLGAERQGQPLALSGRVPTKVTAENGPIRRGDLLVTSSKPGFAMRGDPSKIEPGTVIGKALGELSDGEGTIVVLVNLQ